MVASSITGSARGDSPLAAAGMEVKSSAGGKRADLKALLPSSFVERTLFQVAYTIVHDGAISNRLAWAMTVVEDLQLFSFVFLQSLHGSVPGILQAALTLFAIPTTYSLFVIVNTIAIVLIFFTASLIVVVILLIHRNKAPNTLLKGLRWVCLLTSTVLLLPILNVLFTGFLCRHSGSMAIGSAECFAPSHIPFLVLNAVCLIAFVPLQLVSSLVLVDTSPASFNALSCTSGQATFQSVLLRVLLVALKVFIASESGVYVWVYMGASALAFAYQSFSYITLQPYHDRFMNMFRTGMAFASFIGMGMTMISFAMTNAAAPAGQRPDFMWIILVVVIVLAAAIGAGLSRWYLSHLVRRTVSRNRLIRAAEAEQGETCLSDSSTKKLRKTSTAKTSSVGPAGQRSSSPPLAPIPGSELDLSGNTSPTNTVFITSGPAGKTEGPVTFSREHGVPRDMSSTTLSQALTSRVSGALSKGDQLAALTKGRRRSSVVCAANQRSESIGTNKLKAKEDGDQMSLGKGSSSTDTLNVMTKEKPKVQEFVFNSPHEIEINLRFIRYNPTERHLAVAMELIERGLIEFPNSPEWLMSAAVYLSEFFNSVPDGERAAEVLFQTVRNKQRHLPLGIRFMVYARDRQGKEHGKDVLDSAALDQLMRKARHLHLLSLVALRDIWESLRIDVSDEMLSDAIAKLSDYERGAEECYKRLLERNSKEKKTVLRLYSTFLQYVKGDARAAQFLELAEELETVESRAHTSAVTSYQPQSSNNYRSPAVVNNPVQRETFATAASRSPATITSTAAPSFIMPTNLSGTDGSESGHHADRHEEGGESFRTPPSLVDDVMKGPTSPPIPYANLERTTGFTIPKQHHQDQGVHEFDPIEAGRSASQTSGTSASRLARKRLVKRRMMVDRIEQPLNQTLFIIIPVALVTLSVAIGFYVSLGLYNDSSQFLNVEFNAARDARAMSRRIIESIRLMVSSNLVHDRPAWQEAHDTVSKALDSLMSVSLPLLNEHYRLLPVVPKSQRLSWKRSVNGNITDFDTVLVSPLNAVERVAQAATIALGYQYHELMPEVFESIPQLNIITGHMRQLFDLVAGLMAAFTDAYRVNLAQSTTILVVFAVASIAFLASAMAVTHKLVLSKYFSNESGLYSLLRRIQKRPLSNLVTSLEEEIENFREIGLGDLEEDVAELRGMTVGGNKKSSKMSRKLRFSIWMSLFSAMLAVLMLLMYSITITSLNQSADLDRLVLSLDRRMYTTLVRVFTREWTSYDRTVSAVNAIRNLRIVVADLNYAQDMLLNDPRGLSTTLPELTSLPRKCPTASSCLSSPPKPSIGYTLESGMVPLNVAITRMAETASEVVAAFVATPVVNEDTSAFTNSSSYGKYELLMYQCADIIPRVEELDQGIQAMMNRRVVMSSSITISIFVAFLAVEAVGLVVAWICGLERLRRESRALTSLPFLLPSAILSATKELDAFVESGGLSLREGEIM